MKWYWWALIAVVLVIVIYVAVTNNKKANADNFVASIQNKTEEAFDPYKIIPIAV